MKSRENSSTLWWMEASLEKATGDLVAKNFEVEIKEGDDLLKALAVSIGRMMNENPVLLKSIFYRIDLNESKLGMALVSMEGESLHEELAQQVIERMKKKAETRLKFSRPSSD